MSRVQPRCCNCAHWWQVPGEPIVGLCTALQEWRGRHEGYEVEIGVCADYEYGPRPVDWTKPVRVSYSPRQRLYAEHHAEIVAGLAAGKCKRDIQRDLGLPVSSGSLNYYLKQHGLL